MISRIAKIAFTMSCSSSALATTYDDAWVQRCENLIHSHDDAEFNARIRGVRGKDADRALFVWFGRYVAQNDSSSFWRSAPDIRFFHHKFLGLDCGKLAKELNEKNLDLGTHSAISLAEIMNPEHLRRKKHSTKEGAWDVSPGNFYGAIVGAHAGLSGVFPVTGHTTFDLSLLRFFFSGLKHIDFNHDATNIKSLAKLKSLESIHFRDAKYQDVSPHVVNEVLKETLYRPSLKRISLDSPHQHDIDSDILLEWLRLYPARVITFPVKKDGERVSVTRKNTATFLQQFDLWRQSTSAAFNSIKPKDTQTSMSHMFLNYQSAQQATITPRLPLPN